MKDSIYIFTNGRLQRKDNTLLFENKDGDKRYIPVENVNEIYAFGQVDFNSELIVFLSQKKIILHYHNYYDYYCGSFYPREHYNSGYIILKQAEYYLDYARRLFIAKQFVIGAAKNCLKILKYYCRKGKKLEKSIEAIEEWSNKINNSQDIEHLMFVEGKIKQIYYQSFNHIIENNDFRYNIRTRRPPKDFLNSLISFVNSIIYPIVLSEIYNTHLDPRIGFLHSTNSRRFSLNLDIAEIFKPVIGDRTIFHLLNKKMITGNHFENALNGIVLNEKGKKVIMSVIDERLQQTIKHSKMNKNISYRRLIRVESYKLEKHIMDDEIYSPFVMDW